MKIFNVSCSAADVSKFTRVLGQAEYEFVDAFFSVDNISNILDDEFCKRIIIMDERSEHFERVIGIVETARLRYDLLYLIVLVSDPLKVVNAELLKKADDIIFPMANAVEIDMRFVIAEKLLDDRRRAMQALTYDPVSGALNALAVENVLLAQYERTRRDGKAMSVIILELDDYRQVLENCGVKVANKLAQDMVEMIRLKLRRYDIIGRFRENSLVLLLPSCTINNALSIGRRIKRSSKDDLLQTVSMGIAGWTPGQHISTEVILSEAFNALNIARLKGKDAIETVDWLL